MTDDDDRWRRIERGDPTSVLALIAVLGFAAASIAVAVLALVGAFS